MSWPKHPCGAPHAILPQHQPRTRMDVKYTRDDVAQVVTKTNGGPAARRRSHGAREARDPTELTSANDASRAPPGQRIRTSPTPKMPTRMSVVMLAQDSYSSSPRPPREEGKRRSPASMNSKPTRKQSEIQTLENRRPRLTPDPRWTQDHRSKGAAPARRSCPCPVTDGRVSKGSKRLPFPLK